MSLSHFLKVQYTAYHECSTVSNKIAINITVQLYRTNYTIYLLSGSATDYCSQIDKYWPIPTDVGS